VRSSLLVLQLHDEWLDVLALAAPLGNALLRIRVEVLLLLVLEGLGSQRALQLLQVLVLSHSVLGINLVLQVIVDFQLSLLLLLLFLGLCDLEFLVPQLPEFHELRVLAALG
jgi:hypothetical protein